MWILQTTDDPSSDASNASAPLTFRLSPGAVKTIGRAPRADFIVDTATVSRLHCRLSANQERLEVVDLDSTNGTFVNDERIARAVARGDGICRFGGVFGWHRPRLIEPGRSEEFNKMRAGGPAPRRDRRLTTRSASSCRRSECSAPICC